MVNEDAAKVVAWYWDSMIVNTTVGVFFNNLGGAGARLLITGRPGTGKTTYAYYGLKIGYIKYLLMDRCAQYGGVYCVDKHVKAQFNEELNRFSGKPLSEWGRELLYRRVLANVLIDALETLEKRYGELCFGSNCTKPDGIDEKLKFMMLVSESDVEVAEDLIEGVISGAVKPPKALILDDMVYKSNFWDPEYRSLYKELKALLEHHRFLIPMLVATAISRSAVIKEYIHASRNIDAMPDAKEVEDPETGDRKIMNFHVYRWFREVTLSKRGYDYEKNTDVSAVFTGYTIMGRDYIPKLAIFKMPKWLEEAHWDRRKRHLLRVIRKARAERRNARKKHSPGVDEEEEDAKH